MLTAVMDLRGKWETRCGHKSEMMFQAKESDMKERDRDVAAMDGVEWSPGSLCGVFEGADV